MNKHQLQLFLAGLITALTLLLTGCGAGPDDHRGAPGTVVDRDRDYSSATKHWDYDLKIRRPDGSTYWLDVTRRGYDRCYRGSAHPKCVDK